MSEERLQKVIAQAGVASRRAAEALITEGRVRVNGRVVTTLGAKADPAKDRIDVDGKRVVAEKPAYYVLHKPRGVVTTLDDPEGRQTIAQLVKGIPERVFPVGRLDYHTSGVLLVTNDGAMSQALLHPKRTVPKTYVAKVRGQLEVQQLDQLRNGVALGGGETSRKAEVFVLREERNNTWIQLTITEGKNRQIHRMVEAIGSRVGRLARVSFAGLTVEGLRPGEHRELTQTELNKLKRDYLNPQKRAVVAKVRKEALESAMIALGYNPDPSVQDAEPIEEDGPIVERRSNRPPRTGQASNGTAPSWSSQPSSAGVERERSGGRRREEGRAPSRSGVRIAARPDLERRRDSQRPTSQRPPSGPQVEVMTVRRRVVAPSSPAPAVESTEPPPARQTAEPNGKRTGRTARAPRLSTSGSSTSEAPRPRRKVVVKAHAGEDVDPFATTLPDASARRRVVRKVVTPRAPAPAEEEKPRKVTRRRKSD